MKRKRKLKTKYEKKGKSRKPEFGRKRTK